MSVPLIFHYGQHIPKQPPILVIEGVGKLVRKNPSEQSLVVLQSRPRRQLFGKEPADFGKALIHAVFMDQCYKLILADGVFPRNEIKIKQISVLFKSLPIFNSPAPMNLSPSPDPSNRLALPVIPSGKEILRNRYICQRSQM